MRNIKEIIENIRKEIPSDYEYKSKLEHEFDNIIDSVNYTAPEAMVARWEQLTYALQNFLGFPDTEWKEKIINIFNDKESKKLSSEIDLQTVKFTMEFEKDISGWESLGDIEHHLRYMISLIEEKFVISNEKVQFTSPKGSKILDLDKPNPGCSSCKICDNYREAMKIRCHVDECNNEAVEFCSNCLNKFCYQHLKNHGKCE